MLPDGLTIRDLLPHRDRMLIVEEVLCLEENKTVTRSTVTQQWPLADDQGAQTLVVIELTAQTAGIHNGWQMHQRVGPGASHKGWIVGIKSAQFFVDRLPLGSKVIVTSENQYEFEGFREIRGTAAIDGDPVAEVTMQLMQAEEDESKS